MNVSVFKDTDPTNRINKYIAKFNNTNNTTVEKETLITNKGNVTKTVLTRPKGNTTEQITRYWIKKDNETRVYTTVNGNMDSDNFAKILAKSK